jgi:hypothetical protein
MRERSVAEVAAELAVKRRERDSIISRQSFYCTRRKRLVTPAYCHDCFANLPYLERLTRWNENRMRCVKEHSSSSPSQKRSQSRPATASGSSSSRPTARRPAKKPGKENYSIEEYLTLGLLEFLLDLDVLTGRFETWCGSLADAARERVHKSAEAQEMILWLAERLQGFQRTVLLMGRRPEEQSKDQKKEEQCGVKN